MRYYHLSNGCTVEQAEAVREAGVLTGAIESDRSAFYRLERGSILHRRDCPQLSRKDTVVEHHSLLSVAGRSVHSPCTRWQSTWGGDTIKNAAVLVKVALIVTETMELKERSQPAFGRLDLLLAEVRDEEAHDLFIRAYGNSEVHERTLKDLLELKELWAQSSSSERASACVIRALTCPRSSIKLLGARHDKAWRLAVVGWEKWADTIAAERPLAEAHTAAQRAILVKARKLERDGEEVLAEETAGIRALTRSWERTLERAASAAEGEVLVVAQGPYHLLPGRSHVATAAAAFPSAKNSGAGTVALRCPTQVADWLTDGSGGWQARTIRVLGVAGAEDTPAVLETLVAVWDPRSKGDAADPHQALKAARTLAG